MNLLKLKSIINKLNDGLTRPAFQATDSGILFLGVAVYTPDQLAPYMADNPSLDENQAVMALVAIGLAQISDTIAQVTSNMAHSLVSAVEGDQQAVDTMLAIGGVVAHS